MASATVAVLCLADPLDDEEVARLEFAPSKILPGNAFVLRGIHGTVSTMHETHQFGLFPEATWLALLREAGLKTSSADLSASRISASILHETARRIGQSATAREPKRLSPKFVQVGVRIAVGRVA